jgi:hypothetical protein
LGSLAYVNALVSARRFQRGAEPALGFVVGAATFALVATLLGVADADLAVIALGAVCIAGVIAIARAWSVAFAVPAAMAAYLAYDWYELPPIHEPGFPGSGDLADLLIYIGISVLIGQLAAHAARRAEASNAEVHRLVDEQAALRRVATLVVREQPAPTVLSAVAEEVSRLLGGVVTHVHRFESDGTLTCVASHGATDIVGLRLPLEGENLTARVFRTGAPARSDDYANADGPIGEVARSLGVVSAVGVPITVDGRVWGPSWRERLRRAACRRARRPTSRSSPS